MLGRKGKLERRLEKDRPEPRGEFVSALAQRIGSNPARGRSRWRPVFVAGLTAFLILAFALTGGIGYAASAVQNGTSAVATLVTGPPSTAGSGKSNKPDTPNNPNNPNQTSSSPQGIVGVQQQGGGDHKITICHYPPGNPDNPQTISIDESAWPAHQEHGDTLGPCDEPSPPDDQYEDKVLICHIPPGNPDNRHTIRISQNAVPAHLAHGDTLGPCPED